jgi:hypothetical protein
MTGRPLHAAMTQKATFRPPICFSKADLCSCRLSALRLIEPLTQNCLNRDSDAGPGLNGEWQLQIRTDLCKFGCAAGTPSPFLLAPILEAASQRYDLPPAQPR